MTERWNTERCRHRVATAAPERRPGASRLHGATQEPVERGRPALERKPLPSCLPPRPGPGPRRPAEEGDRVGSSPRPQEAGVFLTASCADPGPGWKEGPLRARPWAGEVEEESTPTANSSGSLGFPPRDTHPGDLSVAAKQASGEGGPPLRTLTLAHQVSVLQPGSPWPPLPGSPWPPLPLRNDSHQEVSQQVACQVAQTR